MDIDGRVLMYQMEKYQLMNERVGRKTSYSQVNSYFPYRWSLASLTFYIYFYLFLYFYISILPISIFICNKITINNGSSHLKSPKNQNRRAALGWPAIKLLRSFNQFAVDQPSPLVLPWFLRHLVVRFAWKIPSS